MTPEGIDDRVEVQQLLGSLRAALPRLGSMLARVNDLPSGWAALLHLYRLR